MTNPPGSPPDDRSTEQPPDASVPRSSGPLGEPPVFPRVPAPTPAGIGTAPVPDGIEALIDDALVEPTLERPGVRRALPSSDPLGLESIDADGFEGPTAELALAPALDLAHLNIEGPGQNGAPLDFKPETPPWERAGPNGVLDQIAAVAATLPPADGSAPPTFLDEHTVAQLPAYSDDNDPLAEQTADLDTGDMRIKTSSDGSVEPSAEKPHDGGDGATVEGAPVVDGEGTDVGPLPPDAGQTVTADDGSQVRLEDSLGEQGGCVFFRARVEGEDQPYTAVWTASNSPEPPWAHLPDPRIVRPRCRVTLERAALRVFERPKGNTVVDYLSDDERVLPAMATIELGIELAELLEGLHGAGHFVYDLDPSQIVIERGGRVRLYAVSGLYAAGAVPTGQLGMFVAPEVRRRLTYRMGAHSDVFACALLIYALLAKRAPIDVDLDPSMLESPRVFRPECPLGIWPFLRLCLEPNPARRVGHARGLKHLLEKARTRLINEARAAEEQRDVVLEAWAEQHTGLAKARRGSGQQDRALSVTDEGGRIGLYLIADGVSRSRFGDGAFAAEQVELAALQRWGGLEKGGQAALDLNHTQRSDIMKQISRSAGKRISAEVNAKYAPIANEPNQVMSSTLCAMFVVRGEATFGNLGDSRAYLIRDGSLEQVSIDHDRCTDALRMGLTFREAAGVQMGSALTRVVGRVIVDDDGTTRPDPFEPEVFRVRLLPGDRVLLCSDGVADFAAGAGAPDHEADQKMLETLLEWEDPARAAFELVVLANRAGGFDNISCVVIAVHEAQ